MLRLKSAEVGLNSDADFINSFLIKYVFYRTPGVIAVVDQADLRAPEVNVKGFRFVVYGCSKRFSGNGVRAPNGKGLLTLWYVVISGKRFFHKIVFATLAATINFVLAV